jgi:Zn-dependent membrane protease YugP
MPSYFLVLFAALALGLGAQFFVRRTYSRYDAVPSDVGLAGAEVARRMLDAEGLHDVGVETVEGTLTDHYDPRSRTLRLSGAVYQGRSVSAAGIAAHEAGHAVQHARAYAPARIRQAIVPAASFASRASWVLILLGLFLGLSGLMLLGVAVFAVAVLFQIVTLPVEIDASRRAVGALEAQMLVTPDQLSGARRVLTAAALTYVAAALVSVMYLFYYLGLARR